VIIFLTALFQGVKVCPSGKSGVRDPVKQILPTGIPEELK
jgi:hypothetical protein